MKRLTALLLVGILTVPTFGATVELANEVNNSLNLRQSQILERAGNPTAQEISDFNAGTYVTVVFTTNNATAEAALDDLAACAAAVELACTILGSTGKDARYRTNRCRGNCMSGTSVRITP